MPHSKLNRKPLLVIPRTKGEVNVRLTHLSEIRGTPYHCYIDIHEPILASYNKKITKSGDVLDTSELLHGHTRKVPYAPPDTHQGNAKQTNAMGLPLPSSDTPLDSSSPVNGTQAAKVSQSILNIPRKGKIKNYSSPNSIPTYKAHRLIPSNKT